MALESDDLKQLESVGAETVFAPGAMLIEHGQPGTGLYVVLDGSVVVEAPEGTRELGAGSVIGERALFSADGRRTARVRTDTGARVLAVDRAAVDSLCDVDAGLASRIADAAS
jgi:CRP-like cAMP-binding protein